MTNGESAAGTLRRTGLGGSVLAWNDVLHEGPVPALPADELREVRARFFSQAGWGSVREILDDLGQRDRLFDEALWATTSCCGSSTTSTTSCNCSRSSTA